MASSSNKTVFTGPKLPLDTDAVIQLLRAKQKRILTFLGFGELGYEETDRVLDLMRSELASCDPVATLINTGTLIRVGGLNGIADVYPLARHMGFETSGIHPSIALGHAQSHRVSADVDEAFFVRDDTWGGFLKGEEPSPTLRTLLEVSDSVVVIGGGKHAADEMQAFWSKGTPLRYHPADMNHAMSRAWSKIAGVPMPSLSGEAFQWWTRKGSR